MAGGKKKSKQNRAKKETGKKEAEPSPSPKPAVSDSPAVKIAKVPNQVLPPEAVPKDAPADTKSGVTKVGLLTTEPARRGPLTEMVPVRFDVQMLSDVRARAADDHRSVSSWIRRAVDLELQRNG